MALTPLDIHHKEFRTARFGGYNEEEVDSFLDQIADEFEKMVLESTELKQQIEQMKRRLSEFEEMQTTLQSALLAATKSAEAVKEQANRECEAMVAKAQEESDSLIKSSQEQARQMMLRAENERQKLERNLARLNEMKRRYLQSLKELAGAHLAQVEELESKDESEMAAEAAVFEDEVVQPTSQTPPLLETPPPVPPPPNPQGSVTATPPAPAKEAPREVPTTHELEDAAARQEQPPPQTTAEMKHTEVAVKRSGNAGSAGKAPRASRETSTPQGDIVVEEAPASANLVDELLSVEGSDDVYAEFSEAKEEGALGREQRGKKTRKEKRDKHFFWE